MVARIDQGRFLDEVLDLITAKVYARVRPTIPSATLRNALQILSATRARILRIPHFWAVYVHDGHGPIRPVKKVWLVWYTNPKDDPRLAGGYPVRRKDIKTLNKAQWLAGLQKNEEREAAGLEPFMVVREFSPARKGTPFFDNLSKVDLGIDDDIGNLMDLYVTDAVPSKKDVAEASLF